MLKSRLNRRAFLASGLAAAASSLAPLKASAQAADTPLKIGVLGDFSAAYANISGMPIVEAVKMAIEDFGGDVLGKPVDVIWGNTQLKADIAGGLARDWFDNKNVDIVTDLPGSATALAVMAVATPRKKIVFATSAVSSEITGKSCTPYTVQWNYDTYSVAHSLAPAIMDKGGKDWFFISLDTITGASVQKEMSDVINAGGGKIVGIVRAPTGTMDFSSFLLQAQASQAKVICFSVAGGDGITLIKQAAEFGLIGADADLSSKPMFAGCFVQPDDIRVVGLQTAHGLIYASAFDWNIDDQTRAFAKRFFARAGVMPNQAMAATYSSMTVYLNAVKAAGTKDADAVLAKMREVKVNDVFTKNGQLRIDGRMAHGGYVMQAKAPKDSTGPWDVASPISYVQADVAVRPLNAGGCPLVK